MFGGELPPEGIEQGDDMMAIPLLLCTGQKSQLVLPGIPGRSSFSTQAATTDLPALPLNR